MSTLKFLANVGQNAENGVATSIVAAVLTPVPARKLIVVRVSSEAVGSSGFTDVHTLLDDAGTEYTKWSEGTQEAEPFRTGTTLSLWTARRSTVLPAGTLLTAAWGGASLNARAISIVSYDPGASVNDVQMVQAAMAHASSDGSSDPSVTVSPDTADDYAFIGAGAFDSAPNQLVPTAAAWTPDRPALLNGGNNFTGMTLFGQWRSVDAGSQTWTMATANGRRWVLILAAFEVVPPIVDLPEGGRQFQADFDTSTDGVTGTSTSRRPDAVSRDYQSATAMGPIALDDASEGADVLPWKARVEGLSVRLARQNDAADGYDAEVELFTFTGAPIDELSLAFDRDGHAVIAAERTTSGPEVWLYWFDPDLDDYSFDNLGSGRTPRVILDSFPHLSIRCAPTPDVQLFYWLPGTGLARRESRDGFTSVHDMALPYVAHSYNEKPFKTPERRISVPYTRHDVRTGTVDLRRVDSLPFDDALLKRPNFDLTTVGLLPWFQGEKWANPAVGSATDDVTLRVLAVEAVDYIELQCSDTFPWEHGFHADTGAPWNVQVQESDGSPIAANAAWDFTISIVHGGQATGGLSEGQSPRAFRARTRKVVGSDTCYSPWRYFFSVPQLVSDGTELISTPVNCDHDVILTVPGGPPQFELGFGNVTPHPCEGEDPVTSAPPGAVFIGGWDPGTGGGWRQDWSAQHRYAVGPVGWSDPDGIYFIALVKGRVFFGWGSGNGWPLPDPNQSPFVWPP